MSSRRLRVESGRGGAVRDNLAWVGGSSMDRDRWLWVVAGVVAVVVGLLLWKNAGPGGDNAASVADRSRACQEVVGSKAERFAACSASLGPASVSPSAQKAIDDFAKSKVLFIGPKGQAKDAVDVGSVPGLDVLLLGTDEASAAVALRKAGVRGLVIHRDYAMALDRDASVLSRLANHDGLSWYDLEYVTSEQLIYTVRDTSKELSASIGDNLLAALRARLENKTPPRSSWRPNGVRLLASIRLQGDTLAIRHATGNDIEKVLDDVADKLRRRWERAVETQGTGTLDARLPDARLEIQVVTERATVEPRTKYELNDLWEMGVDGMMLSAPDGSGDKAFVYLPGSEASTHSHKTYEEFFKFAVRKMADEASWTSRKPWEDGDNQLTIFRTQHFMDRRPGGGGGVKMFRGLPEVAMADMTDESIRDMLVSGGEWWLRNMHPDNSFVYKYWPDQNRFSTEYNEVRHILAARDLADTWRYRHDPRYLAGSRRAMDWLLQFEVKPTDPSTQGLPAPGPDSILFRYPKESPNGKPANQKLGTVAVALLGWVQWAKATGSHDEDGRIRAMAKYVLSQRDSNGKFQPYNVPSGHPYQGQVNDIVPGEAALALGDVAEYFNDKSWLAFFPKFIEYYQPWFESRAAKKNVYGRCPISTYTNDVRLELVQFGPWSVMANKQYYKLTKDERAAKFGLTVADWMIDNYQWSEERSPFPDYVGGYYKMPEELPAMQTFCYSEGTAAAYSMAIDYAPDRKGKYEKSTREALRFLQVMQYDDVDSYYAARPELIRGGIKYALNEGKIRIDYVGHGLSTVSQYLDAREKDPSVTTKIQPLGPDSPVPGATVSLPPAGIDEDSDKDESGD
jgi:hypothetical protein